MDLALVVHYRHVACSIQYLNQIRIRIGDGHIPPYSVSIRRQLPIRPRLTVGGVRNHYARDTGRIFGPHSHIPDLPCL